MGGDELVNEVQEVLAEFRGQGITPTVDFHLKVIDGSVVPVYMVGFTTMTSEGKAYWRDMVLADEEGLQDRLRRSIRMGAEAVERYLAAPPPSQPGDVVLA